jgi:glycine hydroxymethyltransferase
LERKIHISGPGDQRPLVTSGIRIGTPAISTRGFGSNEAIEVVHLIDEAIHARHDETRLAKIKQRVETLCNKFPIYAPGGSCT